LTTVKNLDLRNAFAKERNLEPICIYVCMLNDIFLVIEMVNMGTLSVVCYESIETLNITLVIIIIKINTVMHRINAPALFLYN